MKRIIIAVLLCVTSVLFFGCSSKKDNPVEEVQTGTNVTVFSAKSDSIESKVEYTGTLAASESVSLSSKVSAKAMDVLAKEGDYVNAGDILLELDKTDIELAYNQAKASYDSAVAGYNAVVNSSSKQQNAQAEQALNSAQIAYDQAKTNYELEKTLYENASGVKVAKQNYDDAKANYDRMVQLFEMGGASQLEVDSAYSAFLAAEQNYITAQTTAAAPYDAAALALQNAENALNNAKQNVGLTENSAYASVENAEASVNAAKSALDIAQNNLNNTSITAPISGYVSVCNVSIGQLVGAGTPIYEIKNASLLDVEINVTDSIIPSIYVGTKASISVSSANLKNIDGYVTMIDPIKDEMTGLYKVKVSIDNSENSANVGMVADVKLTTASLEDIIKIPSAALINAKGSYYVYVTDGKTAKKTPVITGVSDGVYTQIVSGISEGDKVVIDGKDFLSEQNNEVNVTGEWQGSVEEK